MVWIPRPKYNFTSKQGKLMGKGQKCKSHLFHVEAGFGRGLVEHEAVGGREVLTPFRGHRSPVAEVGLVAHDDDDHALVALDPLNVLPAEK